MLTHTGRDTIGEYQGVNLVLDWADLQRYHGNLAQFVVTDRLWGQLLRGISIFLYVVTAFFAISSARWNKLNWFAPDELLELLPWLATCLWLYAMYLLRNRQEFNFNREGRDLDMWRKQLAKGKLQSAEVDNYLDYALYKQLDSIIHHQSDTFVLELSKYVLGQVQVQRLLSRIGAGPDQVWQKLNTYLTNLDLSFDTHHVNFFSHLFSQAVDLDLQYVDAVAVFFTFAHTVWQQALVELNIQPAEVQALGLWVRNEQRKHSYERLWERMSVLKPKGVVNRAYTSRYAPTLETYSEDYTKQAATGKFVVTLGKEQAMMELMKTLQRENNAAAIVVGDPGVGKTQFLRHLAVRMVVEDVPNALQDKRLVVFNFNKAFTQNQSLENFKVTLESLFTEVAKAGNVVLVMDDMDQLLNVRSDLQAEIVNLLVSAIDKYNLKLVGTAATEGYVRLIKPIRNLSSLFQPILLAEPDPLISLQILIDQAGAYERKYGIKVQIDSLRQIVALAPKYAYERVMPDKAIDLLEETILEAREKGMSYLTADIVSAVVSRKVGVSVGNISQSESQMLIKLEESMHRRVVGQDMAIRAIAAALRRARAGLAQSGRPLASFLFFGPTGVGKTEVARTLAATYYGDEKMMIRIDMSEYQEERNLERLIGHNEGGRFIGGYLTDAVRSKPFSLVLLDEIEKANPKVLDLFLQILDEGSITDGAGRKADFTNTIIIATSNAGSREIAELIGEGMKYDSVYTRVLPVLRQVFRIEFLNRFDKIIMFKPLLPIEVQQIADGMLEDINENLMAKGMGLEYTPEVVTELVQLGYNPIYGAREIRRVIQEQVEDRIAEKVVSGELVSGGGIRFENLSSISVQ